MKLTGMLDPLRKDISYSLRVLGKSPGFTAAVVLSLALGIGANTAIFSLIDAVMWRLLPVKDPQSLLVADSGVSYQQYQTMRDNNRVAELAAYSPLKLNVSIGGSLEPTIEGQLVSGTYFGLLGVRPAAGRVIAPEEDRLVNGHPVAMLSYGYWKRRFGLAPETIGKTISISGNVFTIIGITPPEFFGTEVGAAPDVFVPLMMQPAVMPSVENLLDRPIVYSTWLRVLLRLKPGVQNAQASGELTSLYRQGVPRGPKFREMNDAQIALLPAATGLSDLRRQFSQPLFVLMGVVGIVLLIACANTANLLLARAAARRSEFAMRLALGASRWRLLNQLLVESIVLAAAGGLCGVLVARWAAQLLVAFMSSGRTPIVLDLRLDPRVLAFTAAVSLLTGILFGLAPALRATRIDLIPALKNLRGAASRAGGGLGPGRLLAVFQVALSLLLLVGAGLFVRSLQNLNGEDEASTRESVLIVRVEPKGSDQRNIPGTSQRLDRTYRDLLQRIQAIPGVRSASMAQFTPTNRRGLGGPIDLPDGRKLQVFAPMVYPNYFTTMSIPVVAGRDFNEGDLAEHAPPVAVVNESFARQAYDGGSALGKPCLVANRRQVPCEIIGIVKDSRYANLRSEAQAVAYTPFLQTPTGRGQMALHVRVEGSPASAMARVREEVQQVDKDLPMFEIHTLAEEVDTALIRERLIATLSSLFSVLALLLASVGLYGLLAFAVVQRTGEMGIRMALGAGRSNVLWMVMRDALSLVLLGIAIGVPATLAVAKLASTQISGLLFGLKPSDPLTIMGAIGLLAAVAAIAGYLPARRASRVDPMVALRNE